MLKITIPETEYYDEVENRIFYTKEQTLQLEHSLISLSKWESKWHKPFMSREPKTNEESLDYIRCMTVTPNVDPSVYSAIPPESFLLVNAYVEDSMTATRISEQQNSKIDRSVITSEVIYYYMVALEIPFECEKWHLNRLLTLIRVCDIKNSPQKKMSAKEVASRNRSINEARKRASHTRG
jgi:hypothetical protein